MPRVSPSSLCSLAIFLSKWTSSKMTTQKNNLQFTTYPSSTRWKNPILYIRNSSKWTTRRDWPYASNWKALTFMSTTQQWSGISSKMQPFTLTPSRSNWPISCINRYAISFLAASLMKNLQSNLTSPNNTNLYCLTIMQKSWLTSLSYRLGSAPTVSSKDCKASM